MNTDNKTPLWKELNEKRTQGVFIVDGDLIVCTDKPDNYPTKYNDGIVIFENITNDTVQDDGIAAHFEQATPNKKYTCLAVNHLHILAEALEALHNVVMQSNDRAIFDNGKNAEIVAKAKEALKNIS